MPNYTRILMALAILPFLVAVKTTIGQTIPNDTSASNGTMVAVPKSFDRAATALDGRYSSIGRQVDKQTASYLTKLESRELAGTTWAIPVRC